MAREEEIDSAKTAFYKRVLEDDYYYDPRDCFEEGAKWADEHSKSPWISIEDDLPCNHQELLEAKYETKKVFVLKTGGFPDVDYMLKVNGKWTWASYKNSKFWMPIPEPPKEKEIKL